MSNPVSGAGVPGGDPIATARVLHLKAEKGDADNEGVIDYRLLEQWQRDLAAREVARASLPASWLNDPRPKMRDVCEAYIEGMLQMSNPRGDAVAIGDDDR